MPEVTSNENTSLVASLCLPLAELLHEAEGSVSVSLLYRGKLSDSPRVFVVRVRNEKPCAVVLCSPEAAPKIVGRAMQRALECQQQAGSALGRRILQPLAQGHIAERTYAVLPYCYPLSDFRPLWYLQRHLLRPALSEWLVQLAKVTVVAPTSPQLEARFEKPLAALATLDAASGRLRTAARSAANRLKSGIWSPKHVLMHGDLWKGNVMVRAPLIGAADRWEDRLVLIDWAGASVDGYPLFDLVRALAAFKYNGRYARQQLLRQCEILECEPADVSSHLCAALAFYYAHLEEWPLPRFLKMSEACLDTIARAEV